VSYTDGQGIVGEGSLAGDAVLRGVEEARPAPPSRVTVAVAPPRDKTRQRFLVEKLAELGVARIVWLDARRRQAAPPAAARSRAWSEAALEQSRGAHLTQVGSGLVGWADLGAPLLVADRGAPPWPGMVGEFTVVVGPEGGWEAEEVRRDAIRFGLGERVLRVETAALVAAALAVGCHRADMR
jgi:16S rRNA U1498 N3-methylase RsmE